MVNLHEKEKKKGKIIKIQKRETFLIYIKGHL